MFAHLLWAKALRVAIAVASPVIVFCALAMCLTWTSPHTARAMPTGSLITVAR